MPKKKNKNQLSLLEQFQKTSDRKSLLVKQLISLIGLVKYYRTCTQYGAIPQEVKSTRIELINSILFCTAQLATKLSRGLPEYKGMDSFWFLNLTKDGTFLSMTEAMHDDELKAFYESGSKRARTLLLTTRDLIVYDMDVAQGIVDNFNKLVKA